MILFCLCFFIFLCSNSEMTFFLIFFWVTSLSTFLRSLFHFFLHRGTSSVESCLVTGEAPEAAPAAEGAVFLPASLTCASSP